MPVRKVIQISLCAIIFTGIFFRLYQINTNQLFYYDEGHYLTIHRTFDELLARNPPESFGEFLNIMKYNLYLSLRTGKGLWFFLSHLRSFFGAFEMFYFPKILAACFGILTIGVVYKFANRFYGSKDVALLSAALIAIMPSHVYYSRLGLQETLSTFCLLVGFYFYLNPNNFNFRTIFASIFFALAYFSNYRMFIIPGLVGFAEVIEMFAKQKSFDWRKYCWCMVTFAMIVIFFGLLNEAGHLNIIFFWMLRQADSAKGHFHFINLFSYPYVIFKLEGLLFGVFLLASIYLMIKGKFRYLLPFFLAAFHMFIFSFAHEKGVRYLCVIMPFMAMAVAYCIYFLCTNVKKAIVRNLIFSLAMIMVLGQAINAKDISRFKSDYFTSMNEMLKEDPNVKILSTQPFIQNLASPARENVVEMPHRFEVIVGYFLSGHQYMVIDPQALISYTKSTKRFDPPLEDHLEFIIENIKPIKEYTHFSNAMIERFVLEHNEDLYQSLEFLKENKGARYNKLRVYKTADYVNEVFRRLEQRKQMRETLHE